MRTLNFLPSFTLVLLLTAISTGCKKDKEEKSDCRIITITPGNGDAYNISYNAEGKTDTISTGDQITTFTYSGNTVTATTKISGVFSSKKIITHNSDGLAINVKTENDVSGSSWNNVVFEYSGTELTKTTYTYSTGGTPDVNTYIWANGNMTAITDGTTVTTIDYYTDEPAQTGDYLDILQLTQGYECYRTKNAIKTVVSGSSTTGFIYSFGADGMISSLTATGSSPAVYSYQYQCN